MCTYCKCGSLEIDGLCTNRGCTKTTIKRTSWKIGDSIIRFNRKMTYKEAFTEYQKNMKKYRNQNKKETNEIVSYYYK